MKTKSQTQETEEVPLKSGMESAGQFRPATVGNSKSGNAIGDGNGDTEYGGADNSGQVYIASDGGFVSGNTTQIPSSSIAATESAKFLTELRELLANLYSDPGSMRRISVDTGLDPTRIYFDASAINVWCDILNEANKQRKVNRLLEVTRIEYPARLDSLTQRYQNYAMFGFDGSMFVPPQERRLVIEIRVNGSYSMLSSEERNRFLRGIDEFMSIRGIEGVNIVSVQEGSMVVALALPHSELADLHRAVNEATTLAGYPIIDITMHNADFSLGNLRGVDLHGSAMNNANLYQANLMNANLMGVDLSGANLSKANLSEANLSRAILTGAKLDQTILWNVSLYNADLRGADLSTAVLSDSTLEKLAQARYNQLTKWPENFSIESAKLTYIP